MNLKAQERDHLICMANNLYTASIRFHFERLLSCISQKRFEVTKYEQCDKEFDAEEGCAIEKFEIANVNYDYLDSNIDKIIQIDVNKFGFQAEYSNLEWPYCDIFMKALRSIIFFRDLKRRFDQATKNHKDTKDLEPALFESLFHMMIALDCSQIFRCNNDTKPRFLIIKTCAMIQKFCLEEAQKVNEEFIPQYCLRPYQYICKYISNCTKDVCSLIDAEALSLFLDIELMSDNKTYVQLKNKIKLLDQNGERIEDLQAFRKKNDPKAQISFNVIDLESIDKKNIEIENNNNKKIDIKNVDEVDIDKLIETIHKDAELLNNLDKYVSYCLKRTNPYFQTAGEFINFKRNKIGEYLKTRDEFKKYEFRAADLEKLDNILLSSKTAVNIVKKFNLYKLNKRLTSKEAEKVNQAVNTFKTLLKYVKKKDEKDEDGKFSSQDFHDFIYNNFAYSDSWLSSLNDKKRIQFSNDNIDNMIDYVDTSKPFSTNGRINTILRYLKLEENAQPSDKLIKFLLNSAKLYTIDSFVKIINSLSVGFGNIDKTLECIFDIKFANLPFCQKLLQIEDIEQKLSPMEMLKSSDPETKKFAFDLLENGIEIKIENEEGGAKKFVINKNAIKLKDSSEKTLISCLEQEFDLNKFVQTYIKDMINEKNKKWTDEELINAKSNAINAFLNSSEPLKQRYNKLLSKTDLLNTVKLLAETSVHCIDKLFAKLSNHAELKKTLLQNWQFTEAKYKYGGISFNDFLFERRSMHITKEYLDFCFKNNLINNTLNVETHKSLYVLLLALEDGNCTDGLLKCFGSTLSEKKINFVKLICANPETENFEQCLANAIYQLIRTSPDYTDFGIGINNDKQIKAISNVLANDGDGSNNYKWFRDGLFTWLRDNGKNINDILKQNKDLDTMLSVCCITVEYDEENRKIECKNSNEIKNASVPVDQILNLFKKSEHDTTVSLSEIKRIMKREEQRMEGVGDVGLSIDQNQQNLFISLISEGQIVISTSKISELFDLENKDGDFFETNDIARKFMWKIIDDELFNPKTGLFRKRDISEGEICEKYKEGLVNCLKKVKIVLEDKKEITVDLSKFKDEFLSSVGIIKFDTLLEKYKNLLDLIKDGQFSISDRNFNGFLELFEAKFDNKQGGQQIISLFEQLTDKIEDFSLSYDNVQQLISTFLNQTTDIKFNQDNINKFCSITQKLIGKKLKLVQDGDDRFSYNGKAQKIFEEICKFFTNDKNKNKDASNIILILDSLIRKQDECYQCGKLIDALNAICDKYELNIDDKTLQATKKSISNKIMITDCHLGNLDGGYKFVIDFELKDKDDKKHLNIPINVEYTDPKRNVQVTTNLESYIKNNKLNFECDIKKPNSFNSVIEQIENQFYDTKGGVSQATKDINETSNLDQNDDNLLYVLKSKSQKLSRDTLKSILTKIFEGKKIEDEKVFFGQFAPWFVHILSNYLDLSTLDGNDLSALLDVCIDKNLQFTNEDACQSAKNFLDDCLKATMKNGSESCVNLNFIDSIISRIDPQRYLGDPESDISCIFDFIKEHVGQIKIDNNGFNIYSLVLTIVEQMFLKKDDKEFITEEKGLLQKIDSQGKDILDKFNNSGLYILQKNFHQLYLVKSITDKSDNKFTIVITPVPKTDGVIQQIRIDSGNYELTDKNQNFTEAKDKVENNNIQIKSADKIQSEDAVHARKIITEKLKAQEQLQIKHKNEEEGKNINEAFEKWNEDRKRKEQNLIDDVSFLTELLNEEFDELVKSKFGVLDNNDIEKYEQFNDFLDGLAKIVNCLEGCKDEAIQKNLLAKMKDFQSRIKKESLTFDQMTRFLDLVIKISDWKPSIDQFLSDWCNKYIKADSKKSCSDDLYKYIKDKLQYSSETIENQLKILEFVIDNKEVIDVDGFKNEIQVFLDSGILSFKKNQYEKERISNAVVNFVSYLNIDGEDVGNSSRELQDMFFDYINENIFNNDPVLHLETNKEKKEKDKQAKKEEQEKINNEVEKKEDQDKIKLEQNYQQLKNNIEEFLKRENVTSDNVKNIFKDIDIDFVNGASQFSDKQRVLTGEEQITKFINLLSKVNEKMSKIKNDNNENKNDGSALSLENFFAMHVLSPEQCNTLVQFKVLSFPYITGCLFAIADLRNLVEGYLQYENDKKTLATTMFQIIDKFEANIDFGNFEEFIGIMTYDDCLNFNSDQIDRKAIIESMNKYNILQFFICADFKYQLKEHPNQNISLDMIKNTVQSLVNRIFEELKGLDIDTNNQLCYNASVKQVDTNRKRNFIYSLTENLINQLLEGKAINKEDENKFMQELDKQKNDQDILRQELQGPNEQHNKPLQMIQGRGNKNNLIQINYNYLGVGTGFDGNKKPDEYQLNDNIMQRVKMQRKKKILIGVSIPLLILAAAGITATLVIGLEATAILAAFIASCVLAVIGIGLLIYRLCLKNPPNGKDLVTPNDDRSKTMEEQIEKIKENQIKGNQKNKGNEKNKNQKSENEINEI